MSKETFYFSHDYNARSDPKLVKLVMKSGLDALGIYWCIIEMLYEQDGYINLDCIENIAFELHSECERITDVLRNHNLFKFEDDKFYSDSVLRRLEKRKTKSDTTRKSAFKRWDNANAMRTHSKRNTSAMQSKVKESKIKDNKVKNNKRKNIFIKPTLEDVILYFQENGYTKESAKKAFEHYELGNWHDTNGKPVIAWKQKMHTVWFKPENKQQKLMMP